MSISLLLEIEMLTQEGHWSWKMSIIHYIFYLSVIRIIAFLAADCSPCLTFLVSRHWTSHYIHFSLVFFFSVSLLPSQISTACFRTSFLPLFPQYCPLLPFPISERWPFWFLKCHLKSHFFSRSTNFNHLLNNKIWSKGHWSQ